MARPSVRDIVDGLRAKAQAAKPSVALVNLTQEVPKKYLTGYIADLRPPTLQALIAKLCQIGHPAGLELRGLGPTGPGTG